MTSVRKSPNIRSTTGRRPVIAAPTPRPVKPGSLIGVSITRPVPNSSTRPDSTLNGVPASATSSPITNTVGSRRISSASASLTAFAKVSSGIEILRDPDEVVGRREALRLEPRAEDGERVALAPPQLLLVLRAVVRAVDVADV